MLEKSNRPDFLCADLASVQPHIELVRTLSGGTPAMRAAGAKYLPKEPRELDPDYAIRLARSVLFEGYPMTVEALVGAVFKNEITIGEDVPVTIRTYLEDVDLAGNHIDVFGKKCFKDQFEGCSVILVEMPPRLERSSLTLSQTPTSADDKAMNRRPYWVKYSHSQVTNYRKQRINGVEQFTLITFEECSMEADGKYGQKEVKRYRTFSREEIDNGLDETGRQTRPPVFGPPMWELVCKKPKAQGGEDEFIPEAGGAITNKDGQPLSRIPVWIAGELGALPPLLGQAHLNVSHWQNLSDQDNILHITRVPMLVLPGQKEGDEVVVGVKNTLKAPPGEKPFWLEISADGATKAGREHILDIEQRMGMSGLSIMTQRTGSDITATEKKLDHDEKHSTLSTMARSQKDCFEGAIGTMAEYMGLPVVAGGSIELGVSEESLVLTPQHMQVLLAAVQANKLPLEPFLSAVLNLLERAGVLAEDVSIDDWVAKIEEAVKVSQAVGLATQTSGQLFGAPPAIRGMVGAVSGNGAAGGVQ